MNKVLGPKKNGTDYFGFFAACFYLALSAVKMRAYLAKGRFWAEEGADFYSAMAGGSALDNIFFLFNGHLELATNLVVYASTFVDLKYAPLVTTYLSLAIQCLPVLILIKYRHTLGLARVPVLLLLVVAVGLPQAAEVWANSINLHFHFSLLVALIAAISIPNGPPRWVSRVLLGLAGLSGIPANFLAPVFGLLALSTREKERWIQFGILAVTALLQIALLAGSNLETGDREFFSTPLAFWLAPVAQSVISPLFGIGVADQLAEVLRQVPAGHPGSILLAVFFSIPLISLAMAAVKEKRGPIGTLVLSAFILLFMSVFTALGDKMLMISTLGGGRYFYVPNVLLCIAVLASIKRYSVFTAVAVFCLVATSLTHVKHYVGGPAWRSNFGASQESEDGTYQIWPPGWEMRLDSPASISAKHARARAFASS